MGFFDGWFTQNTDNIPTPKTSGSSFFSGVFGDSQNLYPGDLTTAEKLQKQDNGSYNGYCQKFVDDIFNVPYPRTGKESAISAWNTAPNKVEGLQGIKPGDLIYFTPNQSNQNDGHVGIYKGNGAFKSATDTGITDHSLQDWNNITGQQALGYIPVQ